MNKKTAKNRTKAPASGRDTRILAVIAAAVMLAAGIFIGNSISGYYTYRVETDMAGIDSLSTNGFTEVDVAVSPAIIHLTGGCIKISLATTAEQTLSIGMALKGMEGPRPLAHDLMSTQMEVFGVEVLMAKVHKLENGTYYAKLVLKQNNRVLTMDARPSDAIALAVRARALIYVADKLMEKEGKAAC